MKKRLFGVLLVFVLVLSTFTFAEDESADNCAGFWGSIKCFLWGNPANRAGMSWWDRGGEALVGKAVGDSKEDPIVITAGTTVSLKKDTWYKMGDKVLKTGSQEDPQTNIKVISVSDGAFTFVKAELNSGVVSKGKYSLSGSSDGLLAVDGASEVTYTPMSEKITVSGVALPAYEGTKGNSKEQFVFVDNAWRNVQEQSDGTWKFVTLDGGGNPTVVNSAGEASTSTYLTPGVVTVGSSGVVVVVNSEPQPTIVGDASGAAQGNPGGPASEPVPAGSAPAAQPEPSRPEGVPKTAVFVTFLKVWIESPSGTCTIESQSGCGKVYTKEGKLEEGILYDGTTYFPASGYEWVNPKENNLVVSKIPSGQVATTPASPVEPVPSQPAFGSISPFTQKAVAKEVAYELESAGVGQWGTDENKIYNLLEGRSPTEIKLIKEAYKEITGSDLDSDMKSELNDDEYAKISAELFAPKEVAVAPAAESAPVAPVSKPATPAEPPTAAKPKFTATINSETKAITINTGSGETREFTLLAPKVTIGDKNNLPLYQNTIDENVGLFVLVDGKFKAVQKDSTEGWTYLDTSGEPASFEQAYTSSYVGDIAYVDSSGNVIPKPVSAQPPAPPAEPEPAAAQSPATSFSQDEWNAVGITDSESAKKWVDNGFTPADAKEWFGSVGNYPYIAKDWKGAGFSAADVKPWYAVTGNYDEKVAKQWKDKGYTPNEAKILIDQGKTVESVPAKVVSAPPPPPPAPVPKQEVVTDSYNTDPNHPQFTDLKSKIDSDPSFVKKLESKGIDVNKLKQGDVSEIKKLQRLVGVPEDGKWGTISSNALIASSKQEIEQKLVSGEITHAAAAEEIAKLVSQAQNNYEASSERKDYIVTQEAITALPSGAVKDGKVVAGFTGDLDTVAAAVGIDITSDAWKKTNQGDKVTQVNVKIDANQQANNEAQKPVQELQDAQKSAEDKSFYLEGLEKWYAPALPYTSLAGSFATAMSKLGSYQALSNLLFGTEFSQNWLINADSEFWSSAGWRWTVGIDQQLMREACDYDDAKRSHSPGQSAVFILDPYGTAQSVGAIQAEKSSKTSPILCERNTDPKIEAEWKCAKQQVCVNDFCYADENEDNQPDSEEPVQGYFYKISWGVTAPSDRANTPYVDEDGIAVKLNIELTGDKSTWIFKKVGTPPEQVIELKNGNSDGGVIVRYLKENYNKVCIRLKDPMKDIEGDEIKNICADFIISDKGVVEYGGSDRTSSVTSTSPEVEMNI